MLSLYESEVEEWVIELLQEQGYSYLSPEEQEHARGGFSEVVFREHLKDAVTRLNPDIPEDEREYALREVLGLSSQSMIENNETFHRYLIEGFSLEYQREGDTVGGKVVLVDFENPMNNDLIVCNQYTVVENKNKTKIRPDVVLLINGLPLVVIELKNPTDEKATVKKAYTQLQNYKKAAPSLFYYNGVLVASDGLDARAGSLTAGMDRFMAWKTVDGVREDKSTIPQVETLIKGMLRPDMLLNLIKQFTVFENRKPRPAKKLLHIISITQCARQWSQPFGRLRQEFPKQGRKHPRTPICRWSIANRRAIEKSVLFGTRKAAANRFLWFFMPES